MSGFSRKRFGAALALMAFVTLTVVSVGQIGQILTPPSPGGTPSVPSFGSPDSYGGPSWNSIAGAPAVVVTPFGPSDGGNFGSTNSPSNTGGVQESVNAALAKRPASFGGTVPQGGMVVCFGSISYSGTVTIPICQNFYFQAEEITFTAATGDAFSIGANYVAVGKTILAGSMLRIGSLTGPNPGNQVYSATGAIGLHWHQAIGWSANVGSIRGFTRYGVFHDNGDSSTIYDVSGNGHYFYGILTSNGAGIRTYSASPSGSFCGSSDFYIGDAISNFQGVIIDADISVSGNYTYTNANSVNNRWFLTAENSAVNSQTGTWPDGCDVFVNANQVFMVVNCTLLNIRGGNSVYFTPKSTTVSLYGLLNRNTVFTYGTNPAGSNTTTPGFPASAANSQNGNNYPVRIIITGVGSGISAYTLTDINGTATTVTATVALGAIFTILTGEKIAFTYTGSPTWVWAGINP